MTLDPDDVTWAPDNVNDGDAVAVNDGAPYKNAMAAIRSLVAYIQNLNIPDSQTADEIATALAADASAMVTLQNALDIQADPFYGESNLNIPYTFEDVTDWVTAAAGDPTSSLTTISASDLDDDATFGPEWEQDSQTSDVTVYQRTALRPRSGRVYRVTVKGYVGGSNSCTLQAIVAQLNSSYTVTTANKASSQNTTFTAANTLQTVTFTMSVDVSGVDVDLDAVAFIRVGASIGPDTATSTNCRITEIHLEDITEVFSNLDATAIVTTITGSASDLETLKDAIVSDFDANDIRAIVADLDADATSEQNLVTAITGNATARGALFASASGDIDAGAFSAGAVALADMADLAADRIIGRANGAGTGAPTPLTGAQVLTILGGKTGSDATLASGTAGANGQLAGWNGDGDLVDSGYSVLDEDDMSSDSATAVPTQQSVKAYVDSAVARTHAAEQATTSGTAFDFTGIPSGTKKIIVKFDACSLDADDEFLVQIGDSGGVETTNYSAYSEGGGVVTTSTSGFTFRGSGSYTATGLLILEHLGSNEWGCYGHVTHQGGTPTMENPTGLKTLSAELDRVRFTRSASANFDAGAVSISYE